MKAIVFGGSGFIGSHLADHLNEAGYDVTIFDLKPSPYLLPGQEIIIGDMLDKKAVFGAVKGCDYIYNFAGMADLEAATTEPHTGPLTKLDNVILTPHIGSYTKETRLEMETQAVKNLISALNTHTKAGPEKPHPAI